MAITQNIVQYTQTAKSDSSLADILKVINILMDKMNQGHASITDQFLSNICVAVLQRISEVPVPREAENIQIMNIDSLRIIDFFQKMREPRGSQNIVVMTVLTKVYEFITKEEEVSELTCLGLAVIQENLIGTAVTHILNSNFNQKKSILIAMRRLIMWQKTTCFNVPLHIWIVKVMQTLFDEKQFDVLNMIIGENIDKCWLTLIIPAFQLKTFSVVQVMFETQRSE